jgi:hypothetical protein
VTIEVSRTVAQPPSRKTSQNLAWKPLSPAQAQAIELLLLGHTDSDMAARLDRDRATIAQWRTAHPLFQATLARRRAEMWEAPQHKLLALALKAVENLGQAIDGGDVPASLALLKCLGLWGVAPVLGEQDPHTRLRAQARAQVSREGVLEDPRLEALKQLANPHWAERLAAAQEALEQEHMDGTP